MDHAQLHSDFASHLLLVSFAIGLVCGLRAMTAPAVTAWAAHLGWLSLAATPLKFMGSIITVVIFTLLALVELVTDQLPGTPARTKPAGLIPRIVLGGLCGACVSVAGGQSALTGSLAGAVGGIAGAFGGYQVRTRLVTALHVPDFIIAIAEDIVAIGAGLLLLSRF
jgi:uncharacterized membrane protein